jgi:hypothetical protein
MILTVGEIHDQLTGEHDLVRLCTGAAACHNENRCSHPAGCVDADKPWLELYRYWLGKHDGGKPPARRDLDPLVEIPSLVAWMMLIEVAGGEFKYRLVGSQIASYLSFNATGTVVGDNAWAPARVRSEWRRMIATVCETQRPQMAITMPAPGNQRRGFCLALPLVGDAGTTEQVMICIFAERHAYGSKELADIDVFEFKP